MRVYNVKDTLSVFKSSSSNTTWISIEKKGITSLVIFFIFVNEHGDKE
ncbi:MAG: hypothetical protein WA941_13640 [Nitrososphaeraceae archaeon]